MAIDYPTGNNIVLSIEEKEILILYKLLLSKNYVPSKNISEHFDFHSAIHLCERIQIPMIGEYNFYWNNLGPFSRELEEVLQGLCSKEEQVKKFNRKRNIDINKLYYAFQIEQLLTLKFFIHSEEDSNFINTLSALAYMCWPACLPHFKSAINELQTRGINTDNMQLLENAWGYLSLMNIHNENIDEDIKTLRRVIKSTIKKARENKKNYF